MCEEHHTGRWLLLFLVLSGACDKIDALNYRLDRLEQRLPAQADKQESVTPEKSEVQP